MGGRPRKLPSREEVARLYVEENLSTPEIARMFGVTDPHTVRTQLLMAGITLRTKTVRLTCIEPGCDMPVHHVGHPTNGTYGRRCKDHQLAHRREVCKNYSARWRKSNPEEAKRKLSEWCNRLRSMTFEQLCQEIKETPCRFKKEELLRKLRKLNREGKSREAMKLAMDSLPLLRPKQE